MNALIGTVPVTMERELVVAREADLPPVSRIHGDDARSDCTETATAVFGLIFNPLSILGFPGRLVSGMAVPHGATLAT
jgi:hypothetical protein